VVRFVDISVSMFGRELMPLVSAPTFFWRFTAARRSVKNRENEGGEVVGSWQALHLLEALSCNYSDQKRGGKKLRDQKSCDQRDYYLAEASSSF
jgi:hypothetical protein